jgi:hypothetical protein
MSVILQYTQEVMKEIEVGLRTNGAEGLAFFGLEEVNELLTNGAKINLLEPVGILTQEIKQEDGNVSLNITGFSIKIKLSLSNAQS